MVNPDRNIAFWNRFSCWSSPFILTRSSGTITMLLLVVVVMLSGGCHESRREVLLAPFHRTNAEMVENALKSMTEEQKIAQLIIVQTEGEVEFPALLHDASRGLLGGVILQQISSHQHRVFTDKLREAAPLPLMIGTLETSLLNNQFCDATPFPAQLALDACTSADDRQQMLGLFRQQSLATGINCSLEPPIYRSALWDDSTQLPRASFNPNHKMLKTWEQSGMIRLGNSFSHWVQIPNDTAKTTEKILQPYRQLAEAGISGFWIDSAILQPDQPRNYLRDNMTNTLGFDGLLVGSGDLDALLTAGADLVVCTIPAAEARKHVRQLLEDRKISSAELNRRVRRVLAARFWSEKARPRADYPYKPIFFNSDLDFQALRLWEKSPVVLQNPASILPLDALACQVWAPFGGNFSNFTARFTQYSRIDTIYRQSTPPIISSLPLVVLWDSASSPLREDSAFLNVLRNFASKVPISLIHFGDAQRLAHADTSMSIIQLWERNSPTENAAANLLFGAQAATAALPEAVGRRFAVGTSVALPKVRLKYSHPGETGIDSRKLAALDTLVQKAIARKLFPGCQVVVAHQGNIVYAKSFGHLDYRNGQPVTDKSLYDIASLTKIAATTMMTMRLKEEGKIRLENTVRAFIPSARGKNGQISVKQLLHHSSGLPPSLPIGAFVNRPLDRRQSCNAFFCRNPRRGYSIQVAEKLFFKDAARSSMIDALYRMPVKSRAMRYGDVNMVILQQILEKAGSAPLDELADSTFFHPLGLEHITFRPLEKFPLSAIAPTEYDKRWRQQLVHGYVHDRAAALLGGVAGHAGLFSNAEDLAVLFQMLLNGGSYGGHQYLDSQTIELFTGSLGRSHRGLGFDKPRRVKYPSFGNKAASTSFGHGGFTGGCAWADPEKQLVFVFLTNRIHPSAGSTAFLKSRIRQRLHDAAYAALQTYEPGWGI